MLSNLEIKAKSLGRVPLSAQHALNIATGAGPQDTHVPIVTTSSVLAMTYKDGVLVVADTLASYGRQTRYKDVDRYIKINEKTLVATSGDYSDHQMLKERLHNLALADICQQDGITRGAQAWASSVNRILYQKRCKMNPYWLSAIVAGPMDAFPLGAAHQKLDLNTNDDLNLDKSEKQNEKFKNGFENDLMAGKSAHTTQTDFFLGYVDMLGTAFQDSVVATGLGRYFALTLMREKHRPEMTEEEAKSVLKEGMKILFQRDCAASNRIQFAKITKEGIQIENPFILDSTWNYDAYTRNTLELGMVGCSW